MSTRRYTLPVEQTQWVTPMAGNIVFNWEYDEGRDKLLNLYEKGKNLQWNAAERIDWSHEIDKDNPLGAADHMHPLFGTEIWEKLDKKARAESRLHMVSWQFSQFLHGEQGALICAAKIVESVPDMDSKFYAATQVIDEARHVEVYSRYLHEKVEMAYPINPHLKTLLDQVLRDTRWDYTYLGMQVLIEGLALAAFGMLREFSTDPLGVAVNTYVMQDEARHVAFGRFALRDYYPQLTQLERDEREEFCVEACYLMRDRFLAEEVWKNLGFGDDVLKMVEHSLPMTEFRRMLFSRIVPVLKDIGLWGKKIQTAFQDMGVIAYADLDLDELGAADEAKAVALDAARKNTDAVIASAQRAVAESAE
jgi:hypothetical protein